MVASVGPEDDAVTSELPIAVSVRGGAGNDALTGGGGDDALNGDVGADTVVGRAGNDRLTDTSGVDVLDGGSGDDVIASRDDSADRVRCGAGNDTVTADVLDVLEDEPACESVRRGLPIAMAPAPPPALRDTTRPALSRLLVRPATSRLRRRRRPALSWRLSEPGRVTFSVAQLRGRRWRTLHRLVRRGRAGSNTVALRLAFPGKRVRPAASASSPGPPTGPATGRRGDAHDSGSCPRRLRRIAGQESCVDQHLPARNALEALRAGDADERVPGPRGVHRLVGPYASPPCAPPTGRPAPSAGPAAPRGGRAAPPPGPRPGRRRWRTRSASRRGRRTPGPGR